MLPVLIRVVSRCPLIVATDFGGYFANVLRLSLGIGGRYPFRKAVSSVEIAGENREAWANATRLLGLELALTAALARSSVS